MTTRYDHARGALLGLAVGDGLGTTLEFETPDHVPPFPEMATGPHTEVTGGGAFHLAAGQVTDDTHMACCLAVSLSKHGAFDAVDVARRYVDWMLVAVDVGELTRAALREVARGAPPHCSGRPAWEASRRSSAGNGSLMRTAPIGVLLAGDADGVLRASLDDSAITHFDPRCRLACAAFNAAIAAALSGLAPTAVVGVAGEALTDARDALLAVHADLRRELAAAHDALRGDLLAARQDDPRLYEEPLEITGDSSGFVRVAFRLAFWELMHASTFEAGLIDVVNRGGDADTNGAITGALLGARFGEHAIPERWRAVVLNAPALRHRGVPQQHLHPRVLLTAVRDI